MARPKVYLAGPMTGVPAFNVPAFLSARRRLENNYDVILPADMDDPELRGALLASPDGKTNPTGSWGDWLARDLDLLLSAHVTAVVVIDNWMYSRGARLETFVASSHGIPIWQYPLLSTIETPYLARIHEGVTDADRVIAREAERRVIVTRATASPFTIKDSGERRQYASGMVRDTADGKIDYLLVRDGPMFGRWAEHLTRGAKKYTKRNWMLADGDEEYERFRESASRHFEQWLDGNRDEDHAAAVMFNINAAEYVFARKEN